MREIRIFVSSPSDAHFERRRLERVVERLNGELRGSILLRAIRWETAFYSAHETFQTQIPPATECDIVVGILRHRLGTELPPDFPRMPDGAPYPSGTAYEVLTAIEARRTKELPDVYVFRYAEPPTVALDDPETQAVVEEQWERLKGFFGEWFVSSEGQFKAAFHTFDSTDQFEEQIESLLRQWIEEHVLSDRSVSWPIEIKGSPFRGLDAFDTKHAPVFFGRSRDTARALDALKEAAEGGTPYLLLVGPSGAGKSSLARAGLVPRLTAAGVVPSVDLWRVAVFRPAERGGDPFFALAEQLLTADRGGAFDDAELTALPELAAHGLATPRQLADHLTANEAPEGAILAALEDAAEAERMAGGYDRPVAASLLIVADQLDELFAGDISEETRTSFGALLAGLVKTGRVWVVATLRADLYERYVTVAPLLALKTDGAAYDLAPPGPAELAEIVRRPAEAANLVYEADADGRTLDERLIADAERADMLPLLQFTLNRLFEERIVADGETRLTQAAYDAIGGLSGAIDQEAERALAPLKEKVIARLPRLLRDLATPAKSGEGEGASEAMRLTIRSVPLSRAAHDAEARELVQALVDARILLSSGGEAEPTIRIAHQRVLESWGRARDIVAENAEFFRIRQEVEDERRRWEEAGRRRDRLIRPGVPLAEAESIAQKFRDELPGETRAFIQASGNRARLRQRLTAAAALVFLGVAIAAAYLGWRASVAEDEARRNYLTARNTIDTIVFDVAQGLRNVEGVRIESIRTILHEVEKAVDELAQSMPNEAGLYRSRAVMLMLFGDVYLAAGDTQTALRNYEASLLASRVLEAEFPEDRDSKRDVLVDLVRVADAKQTLGDMTGAAADFAEALSIGRALVKAQPDNGLWQRDLAMVLQRLADMRARTGDTAAAEAGLEESLAAARRAAELDPGSADAQEDIAVMLERMGDLKLRTGDLAEATSIFHEDLDLRQDLSAEEPGNTERQRAVAASLSKLGDVKLLVGDRQAGLADYEEALKIVRHLAELDPENVQALADISVLAGKVGDTKLRGGDFASALSSFQESLDIDRRLAALEPANAGWQRNVSVSLNRIGDLKLRTGDVGGALEAYRESLGVIRKVAAVDPDNIGWQRDVNFSLNKVADAQFRLGRLQESLAAYEETLANARSIAEREPNNAEWQADVALGLDRVGGARLLTGDSDGAIAAFGEDEAILRGLVESDPDNLAWKRQLAVAFSRTGDLLLRAGDVAGGLAAYEEELAMTRALAAASPDTTDWQRDLSVSLNRVADAKRRSGDLEGALADYEEALAVARRLVETDPANVQWQRDVAFGLNRIADVEIARGDADAAAARYEEALAIVRPLTETYPDTPAYREDVALDLQRLGDIKASALDADGALALYQEELAIRRDLAEAAPDNTDRLRHLAVGLNRVGTVKAYQEDKPAALALYEEALEIVRGLAATDPANRLWQSDLMITYLRVADVTENPRRREMLSEALPIAIRLQNAGGLSADLADLPDKIRELLAE